MSDGTSSADTASSTGSRLLSRIAGLLLAGQAALLLAALPVIALMFLGSLWEGGDAALKHRLLAWVLFAALGNLVGVVLCGLAAAALLRTRPERRLMATACAVLLAVLAAGWAWVFQGYLFSDLSVLGQWALLTGPGLLGAVLALTLPDAPA